jgi:proteasome lid subunit RPN8/RPN11
MISQISSIVIDEMVKDAISTFPDECCGFLFGKETGADREIVEARIVNNAKEGDKRRRFEISPKDYLEAERYADAQGLLLLGIYHSHPDHPAVPSEHDRLAAQPYFSYVILSVINNEYAGLRSWRLNEDKQFEEEKIYDRQYI